MSRDIVVVKLQVKFEPIVDRFRTLGIVRRYMSYWGDYFRVGVVVSREPLRFRIGDEWIRADQVAKICDYWIVSREEYDVERLHAVLERETLEPFVKLRHVMAWLDRFRRSGPAIVRQPSRIDRAPTRRRQRPEEMPALRSVPASGIYPVKDRVVAYLVRDDHPDEVLGACHLATPIELRREWNLRMWRVIIWRLHRSKCPYCTNGFLKRCTAIDAFLDFL